MVGDNTVAQTEILPDVLHLIGTLKYCCVCRQVKVYFYKHIELLAEFSDKSALAYLTGAPYDKGLMWRATAPQTHLCNKTSFKHNTCN